MDGGGEGVQAGAAQCKCAARARARPGRAAHVLPGDRHALPILEPSGVRLRRGARSFASKGDRNPVNRQHNWSPLLSS
jgi:hypothetical protein